MNIYNFNKDLNGTNSLNNADTKNLTINKKIKF